MFVTENNAGSQIKLPFCISVFRWGGGGGEGGKEKRPPSKKGDPVQLSKLENDQDPLL